MRASAGSVMARWTSTAITDRVADTHVFNLRKNVEALPTKPRYLHSVRGMGYRSDG